MDRILFLGLVAALLALAQPREFESAGVGAFLTANCQSCHSAQNASGGLNLAELAGPAALNPAMKPRWSRILERLEAGEMPPQTVARRPDPAAQQRVMAWIVNHTSGGGRSNVTVRRLNRVEYNNSVRDLLGVDLRPSDDFPQDDSAFGFDNIGDALTLSPLLMEKLMAAAERVARTAVFGSRTAGLTSRFEVPIPRRMEVTNPVQLTVPAFFNFDNYDRTGLSQPGAYHATHRFPADGEYQFRITGAGNRPPASLPGEITFWIDGKLVKTFAVEEVQMSGFERRPDFWETTVRLNAGEHSFMVAFPRQFDGLPKRFKGPNPSPLPEPPQEDPEKTFKPPPPGTPPHKILERQLGLARAKRQFLNPTWDGLAVIEFGITGPLEAPVGPGAGSRQAIYSACGGYEKRTEPGCERKVIETLARRAWRRPASPGEIDRLATLAANARQRSGGSIEEAIAVTAQALLASPNFLFRVDAPRPADAAAARYELASRLSYFLWSTLPDDELLTADVRKPDILAAQVRRMLADRRARALVENFAGQWLEIRRLESVQPDRDRFPDFDELLRAAMLKETELFFAHMIEADRPILDLVDGEYSFLNERLARHYGIAGVTGPEFRKVDLKGTGRSGVLTHASILTATSYATRTSPVLRGKWVLENFLNAPPPPPPPNVPALDERGVGTETSLRKQLEAHREKPVCASCHARMDPLGFALENFDAVGTWRTEEGKLPIDASGALPDGRPLHGADSLKKILREDRDAFTAALAEKLLTYALGRGVGRADRPALKTIAARAIRDGYRFSSLILAIAESEPFQLKERP